MLQQILTLSQNTFIESIRQPIYVVLLLVGSVTGAQLGTFFAQKAKPEQLRLILAIIVLGVALRMALGLGYRPDEIYTVVAL